jgi:hypothetical protein
MQFKVGDEICWAQSLEEPDSIRRGTITKVRTEYADVQLVFVDGHHAAEDCLYSQYCWPARVLEKVKEIIYKRAELLKAYKDSMKLVFELRNQIARGEL